MHEVHRALRSTKSKYNIIAKRDQNIILVEQTTISKLFGFAHLIMQYILYLCSVIKTKPQNILVLANLDR